MTKSQNDLLLCAVRANIHIRKEGKQMSIIDILNSEEARPIIERIEEAENEIRDRGIDPGDESEFWVRARKRDIEELKKRFGYAWE